MKLGNIVKIKKEAIKNGLLKERCKQLLGKEGVIVDVSVVACGDEVSVDFNDGYDAWIMPIESLEVIAEFREPEIVLKFNKFLEKWTGNCFAHLIDSDENDGEEFRQELRKREKS